MMEHSGNGKRKGIMKPEIEILAPAGSYESMLAAVQAGADAVYIGGTRFGARAFADNPKEDMLLQAIDYVHLHGRKLYLTVNTLLKEEELTDQLYEYLLPYYRQGLDAVIVQDMGVLHFIRTHFPGLDIHASTQMTVTGVSGARFLKEQGVSRVVTARELSLPEISAIAGETGLEIESFVHGALCYCYSGQCLLSSMIGGRSGNRGQCAQPCRMPYRTEGMKRPEYLLSLKDICTLEILPELIESGIYSFKIEGRMKKPEYVAAVTSMYRKYTDLYLTQGKEAYCVAKEDRDMLLDIYNRGGFHTGYYHTRNGRDMVSLKRPNHAGIPAVKIGGMQGKSSIGTALTDLHAGDVLEWNERGDNYTLGSPVFKGEKVLLRLPSGQCLKKGMIVNRVRNQELLDRIEREFLLPKMQEKINGILILSPGVSAKLVVEYQGISVEVYGDIPEPAQNQPITEERLSKQLRKTGNTPFCFERLSIQLSGELFYPVQSLNELRRKALGELEKKLVSRWHREQPELSDRQGDYSEESVQNRPAAGRTEPVYTAFYALVETLPQFEVLCGRASVKRIYLDCNAVRSIWNSSTVKELTVEAKRCKKEIFLAMPHIFRASSEVRYEAGYQKIFEDTFDGILVRNLESIDFLQKHDYTGTIILDHNLYQFNREAQKFWKENGLPHGTAPLELNCRELKQVDMSRMELIIYGYLPVMTSAQCIRKTTEKCLHVPGQMTLTDRFRKSFLVKQQCDYCYNVMYNTDPLMLAGEYPEVKRLGPEALRLQFSAESVQEMQRILELYEAVFLKEIPFTESHPESDWSYTKGHFKRGIK